MLQCKVVPISTSTERHSRRAELVSYSGKAFCKDVTLLFNFTSTAFSPLIVSGMLRTDKERFPARLLFFGMALYPIHPAASGFQLRYVRTISVSCFHILYNSLLNFVYEFVICLAG